MCRDIVPGILSCRGALRYPYQGFEVDHNVIAIADDDETDLQRHLCSIEQESWFRPDVTTQPLGDLGTKCALTYVTRCCLVRATPGTTTYKTVPWFAHVCPPLDRCRTPTLKKRVSSIAC
jgi:hypothetical protein